MCISAQRSTPSQIGGILWLGLVARHSVVILSFLEYKTHVFCGITEMLQKFGGHQIRNVGVSMSSFLLPTIITNEIQINIRVPAQM